MDWKDEEYRRQGGQTGDFYTGDIGLHKVVELGVSKIHGALKV